ncbi:efflux RND transporter periplasmic adaptor subunit [Paracoccus sp. (in: a-proteobacteria)]|uniref:efflux RND transporter periplasmic adaptor subunit n=1 Tax=Paracoccus sp. TaxID=267 RepID=UPI00272BE805|nr:efflux RND transporter periplasmic adaptor subunit [Paracoccus sp. (in: a-proteobacteria)]
MTSLRSLLMLGLVPLLVAGCIPDASADTSAEPAAPPALVVPLVTVSPDSRAGSRSFVGRVEPLRTVDLAFQVQGQLIERPVAEGDRVEAGALIGRLDAVSYELAVARAEAVNTQAMAEFERANTLVDRVSTRARLDSAEAERAQAEIALREARRALDQTTITAPFPALVARTLVEEYANVTPAVPILRLQDISEMRVVISLPESLAAIARSNGGAFVAEASFPALPDLRAPLELRDFVTEADPVAQTYDVSFAIGGPLDPRLLPGMTANVHIAPRNDVARISLPTGAIDTTGPDGPRVWVYDPQAGTASSRKVRLGLPQGGSVVIAEGLQAGDSVVAAGWWQLTEGAPVRPGNL